MSKALRIFQGRFGRLLLLECDQPFVEHVHAQVHVLIKCSGDDGVYIVDGDMHYMTDDALILINPWVSHGNPASERGTKTLLLALYVEPTWLGTRMDETVADTMTPIFVNSTGKIDDEVRHLTNVLVAEMARTDYDDIKLENLLFLLMQAVVDRYAARGSATTRLPQANRAVDYRIRRAIEYMRGHTSKNIKLDAAAAVAGLSRSRFFEQFKACTGVTPRLYTDGLCIEAAIERLSGSKDALSEIARDLGFSAQAHFSRFFRQKCGVTPSDYRRVAMTLHENSGKH